MGRWAGPVRVHPIPQLEQVPRSFLDRPLAAELDLDAHPRTARRLDDGIDIQAGIVAVVVHPGVVRLCCAGTGAPRSMAPRDISPVECPDSKSDIGRIESRDIRPAPVCRVVSSGGTAEPVRMKRPAQPTYQAIAPGRFGPTPDRSHLGRGFAKYSTVVLQLL